MADLAGCGPPGKWSSLAAGPSWGSVGSQMEVSSETVRKLCRQGRLDKTVEALGIMVHSDCHVSKSLFHTVLRECVVKRDLALGRLVHALSVKVGYESDTVLCNHILRMYGSQARLGEAMDVFTMVAKPDAFTWSALISAHVKHGEDKQAIELYRRMRGSNVMPDGHVFVAALQACARGADLESGQLVHADVVATGVEPDLFVCSGLVDMYSKCGNLDGAQRVFDGVPFKDVVMWNTMIAGYSQQGMGEEALDLYSAMREEGIAAPNSVTFVSLLQACASVGGKALEKGKQLHEEIRDRGLRADAVLGGSLVNMYAKCGILEDARCVFDGLSQKDVVTWNAMIAGYSQKGKGLEALHLLKAMQHEGMVAPSASTFVSVLQACASLGTLAIDVGKHLHAHLKERGLHSDVFVANSLVNMYAKCGSLEDAQEVFDRLDQKNVVTWNSLIAGYSQQGMGQEALRLYDAMQEADIVVPDAVTFVCLLQACACLSTAGLEEGKRLHDQIRKQGLEADVFVASSLVNMYANCGSVDDARSLFDGLAEKNVVTWNAMIAGYSQQGMGHESLALYRAMREEGMPAPDGVTFVSLLLACANVGALHVGRQLHEKIKKQGLQEDLLVAGSLLNMYGKCGSMIDAQRVFEALPERDGVAWNALIAGYTRQGDSEVVFDLVSRMKEDSIQPDSITFLSILTVCSHTGLVNEAQNYFESMSADCGITPTTDHYTCMVDVLGRAGLLDKALTVVRTMPALPDAAVWHTLLAACRKWSNVEVGRHAFDEAVKLDKQDDAAYVSMLNIYTGAQMWKQAKEMQENRMRNRAWKQPGQSWWTDMDGMVHYFLVGHTRHPGGKEGVSSHLMSELKIEVDASKTESSPPDVADDGTTRHLFAHVLTHCKVVALTERSRGDLEFQGLLCLPYGHDLHIESGEPIHDSHWC